jgi:ubiquitin conjugation factor E4 B
MQVSPQMPTKPIPAAPQRSISETSVQQTAIERFADKFKNMNQQEWENSTLKHTLQVTLEVGSTGCLEELCAELMSENIPLVLNAELTERALYARLTLPSTVPPFVYLLGVWKRVAALGLQLAQLQSMGISTTNRVRLLDDIQNLAISYAGLALNPDMEEVFHQAEGQAAGFLGRMLVNATDFESRIPRQFMDSFIQRFQDDGLVEIISQTIKNILTVARTKKIYEDYMPSFKALMYLLSFKPLPPIICQLSEWNPGYASARSIETLSILGPFISRPSIFPDSDTTLAAKYFGSNEFYMEPPAEDDDRYIGSRNYGDVKSAHGALRDSSATVTVPVIYIETVAFHHSVAH